MHELERKEEERKDEKVSEKKSLQKKITRFISPGLLLLLELLLLPVVLAVKRLGLWVLLAAPLGLPVSHDKRVSTLRSLSLTRRNLFHNTHWLMLLLLM